MKYRNSIIREIKEDNSTKNLANEESGLCDISYARYSEKCFTRIYKASYGDSMETPCWRVPVEGDKFGGRKPT